MTEEESLQAAINEPVVLQAYDAHWPGMFEAERGRLLPLFSNAFIAIEHIGSTAVPGLAAKPVIDILGGVASMEAAKALVAPLCKQGYATSAEFNATLADRQWLMRWADGHRTHHLHLVVHGGPVWTQRIALSRCAARGPGTGLELCRAQDRAGREIPHRPRGLYRGQGGVCAVGMRRLSLCAPELGGYLLLSA
jgi:GrpB-like predicted nucleotidyltransferase (UPF0157 family)